MKDEILIVDGYNIIGAWPELQQLKQRSLEDARDQLLSHLAEYQAFTGMKIIIVFDAHQVPGTGRKMNDRKLEIYYTKENETADERIEKLVKEINARHRQIYVATSDYTEQRVIFGSGALRVSARELLINVNNMFAQINGKVKETQAKPEKNKIPLNKEIEKIFEKWRRQK